MNGKPTHSIGVAALIVAFSGIISRVLGLFRDRILAHQFGAGDVLDIYYAAFRIPDLVYGFLVLGALSAAFIPVFTDLISHKYEKRAWRLAQGVLNLEVLVIGIVAVILAIFAPYVVKVLAPGFSEDKLAQTAVFTRIMFLSPLILGISAVFGGILVSFKKFLVYSLAPIMYNIGIIIGAVFFVEIWGPIGLAWGVVLGAFLHLLIQYPAVRHSGFRLRLVAKKDLKDKNLRKVIGLMIPRTLGAVANQINLLIVTIFASTLASGSLAVFHLANNLQSVPLGLLGIPFAIAVFPSLSKLASHQQKAQFMQMFFKTLRRILFFVVPLGILMIVLRAQIVRVVLGSGQFDWEDTTLTFQILGILSLSLFAQSLTPLLTRSFYSLCDTKTPFYSALFAEGINLFLVLMLIESCEILGLAIAFSVASIVNMLILMISLRAKFKKYFLDKHNVPFLLKVILASCLAGLSAQVMKIIMGFFVGDLDTFVDVLLQLIVAGGVGVLAYVGVSYWLKIRELEDMKKILGKKFWG